MAMSTKTAKKAKKAKKAEKSHALSQGEEAE